MKLAFEQFIFLPSVAIIGNSLMNLSGIENAIVQMGAEEPAEAPDTPLSNLVSRIAMEDANGDDLAEFAGRQCYRSWSVGRDPARYHENIRAQGHGSIYEHAAINFQITGVSRTLTHELIRHRVGTAYSQESQRYVDAKDIRFVVPPLLANAIVACLGRAPTSFEDFDGMETATRKAFMLFHRSCEQSLNDYVELQPLLVEMAKEVERLTLAGDQKAAVSAKKRANEAARSVLHNAAETRLVFTVNLRELRHVLLLRGDEPADLEIRRMAVEMFPLVMEYAPLFFSDLRVAQGDDGLPVVTTSEGKRI